MSEYGDETELEIIIDAGVKEAADMEARWLNPPRPVSDLFLYWPDREPG